MRFGGHETFPVREGWLHKGLKLTIEEPEKLIDEYAADWLGVGRNMAKAIRHWLNACGLAGMPRDAKRRGTLPEVTRLGEMVYAHDPYCCDLGTLWILHTNLIHTPEYAASWHWFFNVFGYDRFERGTCVDSLHRYLKMNDSRPPSPKTLERDVACLLNTYARSVPNQEKDPEEANVSPFTELGVMSFRRATRTYQLHRTAKSVAPEIFCYALASGLGESQNGQPIGIQEATHGRNSPGRVFALTSESLFEQVQRHEAESDCVRIAGQAGERMIRIPREEPLGWVQRYYETRLERDAYAA